MYGKTISLNHWKIYVAFSCLLLNLYLHVKVVFKSLQRQDFFYWFYCSVHWTQIVMQGTVAFKGSYPKLAIGSWICIHVTNFWGCSGSNTFANLSNSVIRTFVVKMSHLRAFVVKSSPTIHEHSPKNCHLRTFCVKMSRVAFTRFCRQIHQSARIGVEGGQANPGNA